MASILRPDWVPTALQLYLFLIHCYGMWLVMPERLPSEDGQLPQDLRRLEWTCRCGHQSYDDFTLSNEVKVGEFWPVREPTDAVVELPMIYSRLGT